MKGDNEMQYVLYTGAERFLTKNGFDTAGISPSKLNENSRGIEKPKEKDKDRAI